MVFVVNNTQLEHIPEDLDGLWKRGVFTANFREHGTWLGTLQEKQRNNVFAFSESESTPFPERKTNGFHSLVIHPTDHAMVSAISVQQGIFGPVSQFVVTYDISRNNTQDHSIDNILSVGYEPKLRYYFEMKRIRYSQVPSEVMNRQKNLSISYCGRVVAVPNMDSVDLLATSPDINDPFDDDTNTPGTVL